MKKLHIDIETYSSVDLGKSGVYRYAESDDFEIILFGYAVDDGDVKVVDLSSGEKIPEEIIEAIKNEKIIKTAHNAHFERVCLSRVLLGKGTYLSPSSWHCTMIWAAYLGLPLSLKDVGSVLGLDKKKMEEGKELIKFFCTPCAPTKSNNQRTRNLPHNAPEKWMLFKKYNVRDVEVEIGIEEKLKKFPVPDFVWDEYVIDQEINDRGVKIDLDLVRAAIEMDGKAREELAGRMKEITELENPNSVVQMRKWLSENGLEMESLGKKEVAAAIKDCPDKFKEVLRLRQQLSKSSVKKYQAMENAVCEDGRARGMFQFYGANRTGRFAGRLIQMQNLPQNHLEDLKEARALVKTGDYEAVKMLYEDVTDTLSQLIRTAFVPEIGTFHVADFSAIEARVLSYLAGEEWRMEVFEKGGDIYCATASKMFHCNVEKNGENGHLRQKGKQCELACGYGGGVGAMKAMGAIEAGMKEDELKPLVDAWRQTSPKIVKFWWDIDKAAKEAVSKKTITKVRGITFTYKSGLLFITLPSGRNLAYVRPRIEENDFGGASITYEGVGSTKKWERLETYGPKIVENIVQGMSRDILCYAMKTLREKRICMHIHDELVIEGEENQEEICKQMALTPPWAEGLCLRADGSEMKFYQKD